MVVYQNSLVTVSYFPETDVILVEWPNTEPYSALEVKESNKLFLDIVKQYDAKKILISAVDAIVDVDYDEYLTFIKNFTEELGKTRVQKVARVYTSNPEREAIMESTFLKRTLPFQFQNFNNKEDAMEWLTNQR